MVRTRVSVNFLELCIGLIFTYPSIYCSYIMSMSVADYSGQAWLQGFNDVGIAVFGMTADELHELQVSPTILICVANYRL